MANDFIDALRQVEMLQAAKEAQTAGMFPNLH